MQDDLVRIEAIFSEALGKPTLAERAAFLDQACGNDPELRERVERLLASHATAGSFMAPPDPDRTLDPYVPVQEGPGSKIGRYKLLQQIGEGGFGVVFMAEQEFPVRRLVALKIIKLGMDTKQVIARFEAERQALAMMDHPGVAKVLDGGATDTGRPYFVMELVKGTRITEYCDKNNLTISKRLELFAQVCQAVQHAHQKGLIHRDIKPSNVLVATQDDRPVVKVIDFGIAKAVQAQLTEKTLFTDFRQMIGTPEYMSPEQSEGDLDIDTRCDVYSLGVLLYELLAGSPPFDAKELRSNAYAEMQRIIREVEPPAPSTRLSTIKDTLPSVAAHRSVEPRKLAAIVHGELDWIVMRCLEKDRKRRYQTASALAEDIQHYLTDEPVQARPPTRTYRMKKFFRRNKAGVLAGSAIVAALILGLTFASIGFVQARHEAIRADREASSARIQAARAEQEQSAAVVQEKIAKQQESIARRRFYAAQMNLAYGAWEKGEPARTLELLDGQRPEPGKEDLRSFEWYYLWRLCNRHLRWSRPAHQGIINYVSISPDDLMIASCGKDLATRIWDRAGKQLRVLKSPNSMSALLFTPDNKKLVMAGWAGIVQLYDLASGDESRILTHQKPVYSLAISDDGSRLASGDMGGVIKVWDSRSGSEPKMIGGDTRTVFSMRFSPDGLTLATAAWANGNPSVHLWDLSTAPIEQKASWGLVKGAKAMSISPDMRTLATNIWNGFQLLDLTTGQLKMEVQPHRGMVFALAYAPDGSALASAGSDKTIWLSKLSMVSTTPAQPEAAPKRATSVSTRPAPLTQPAAAEAVGVHLSAIQAIAISHDGSTLVSGSMDGTLSVWELNAKDSSEVSFPKQGAPLRSLFFTPDGRNLVTVSKAGTRFSDSASGEQTASFPQAIGRAVLSPDGQILVSGDEDERGGMIKIWDVGSRQLRASAPSHPGGIFALALSPDGTTLASGGPGNPVVKLWHAGSEFKLIRTVDCAANTGTNSISGLAFSPNGTTLAVGTDRRRVWFVDARSGEKRPFAMMDLDYSYIWALVYSPNGRLLAAGGDEGIVAIWSTETGSLHAALKGHSAPVRAIAFSPDSESIATGSEDRTVRIWDVATGQERVTFREHPGSVTGLAFSPDGNTVGAGSADGTIKLWRATPPTNPWVAASSQTAPE